MDIYVLMIVVLIPIAIGVAVGSLALLITRHLNRATEEELEELYAKWEKEQEIQPDSITTTKIINDSIDFIPRGGSKND